MTSGTELSTRLALSLVVGALLFVAPARADRVITEDGRILKPLKARAEGDGYRLTFEAGEILLLDASQVKAVEIEGDMSDYVPANDDEREKLEKGYVRYGGKWMSKPAYENQLAKEHEASKERADEMAAHSEWHSAWTKETKHFLVRSNTSPELLEYYCDLLEAYYDLMDKEIGIDPTPTYKRLKMTVNVYKSYEEFQKNSPADIGPTTVGYFWSYDNTLNFYHDYEDPSYSNDVGLHECTHLLTFLIDQQYRSQIWLNEAVADYFGISTVGRDKRNRIEIEPGAMQTDQILIVQQALEDGEHIPLEKLFFIDRESYGGFEYAHGWSFVYFLNNFDGGKYAKNFRKFFKGLYTLEKGVEFESRAGPGKTGTEKVVSPENIRDLLLKKLKVKELEQLEQEWTTFVREIPIEGPEARFKRGYRAIQRGRIFQAGNREAVVAEATKAKADLDAAEAGGVRDPRLFHARGKLNALLSNWEGVHKDLEKAVELAPLNAAYRFDLGRLIADGTVRLLFSAPPDDSDDDEELATFADEPEARVHLGLATELDPENDVYRKRYEAFMAE